MARADLALAARRPSRGISPRVVEWIGEQSDVAGIERLAGSASPTTGRRTRSAAFALGPAAGRRVAPDLRRRRRSSSSRARRSGSRGRCRRSTRRTSGGTARRTPTTSGRSSRSATSIPIRRRSPWLARTLSTPSSPDGVTLATVHKVKGLEWPHVIVHDATSGLFPHRLSTDIEEERRVFHVAITRAMRSLALVADAAEPVDVPRRARRRARPTSPRTSRRRYARRRTRAPPRSTPTAGSPFDGGATTAPSQDVDQHHVTVAIGTSTITIPFGSEVSVDGQPRLARRAHARPRRAHASRSPHRREPRGLRGPQGLASRAVAQGRRAGVRGRVRPDAAGARARRCRRTRPSSSTSTASARPRPSSTATRSSPSWTGCGRGREHALGAVLGPSRRSDCRP